MKPSVRMMMLADRTNRDRQLPDRRYDSRDDGHEYNEPESRRYDRLSPRNALEYKTGYDYPENRRNGERNSDYNDRGRNADMRGDSIRYGYYPYVEDAFYDRDGRRHYDNGRFAPMRNDYEDGQYRDVRMMQYPPDVYGNGRADMPHKRKIGFAQGDFFEKDGDYYFNGRLGHHDDDSMMYGKHRGKSMPDHMNKEMAEEWTNNMENADGTKGPHWKPEEVKQLMSQKKIEYDFWDFYSALNMMYSDYCDVAKKFNLQNNIDFYVCMAKAWLDDDDAEAGDAKTAMYYECIAK